MTVRTPGHFEFAAADVTVSGTERALTFAGSFARLVTAVNTPTLAGIAGGVDGRLVILVNASGANVTLVQHTDAANVATPEGNRLVAHNTTLFNGEGCLLWYDGQRGLWLVVGRG